jgi:hypothetical protein
VPTRDQIVLHLNVEIERLDRRLRGYEDTRLRGQRHSSSYNRTIQHKQQLIAERDRLLRLWAVSESVVKRDGKSRKSQVENPEVAKRRSIVKSNSTAKADDMCRIFDREKVPLPSKWQEAGFKSWADAYRRSNYRSRIDVLVSKDRHNT